MGTGTLIAIGGGTLSAALSTAALSGSLAGAALAYFTPLPLLMTGLALGMTSALVAGVAGVLIVGIFGGAVAAVFYAGIHAVPSWLVVRHTLAPDPSAAAGPVDGRRLGSILGLLAALAGAAVAATLLFGGGSDGAEASVRQFLDATLTIAMPQLGDEDRATLVATVASFFVGGCGATWQIMIVVNAVLSQSLLSSRGRNLRPSPRWRIFNFRIGWHGRWSQRRPSLSSPPATCSSWRETLCWCSRCRTSSSAWRSSTA